jgi:hypothetical protein
VKQNESEWQILTRFLPKTQEKHLLLYLTTWYRWSSIMSTRFYWSDRIHARCSQAYCSPKRSNCPLVNDQSYWRHHFTCWKYEFFLVLNAQCQVFLQQKRRLGIWRSVERVRNFHATCTLTQASRKTSIPWNGLRKRLDPKESGRHGHWCA